MPFGLPGSRSSSKSSMKSSLNNEESGRMYMSGILHDGLKTKSTSKSKKSPSRSPNRLGGNHEQQQQQQQQQQQYQYQYQQQQQQVKQNQNQNQNQNYQHQHQHHQYQHQHTPPRSKTPSGRSPSHQRSRSNNRYPPSQYQQIANNQHETQHHKQYDHVVIPQSHSNQSHSSRNSSHSKQSNTSASAQHNRSRFQHRRTGSNTSSSAHSPSSSNASSRYHNHQHRRVPSANSELGSVHSLPSNVTSRSTISNASSHSHSRNGGRSTANSSHQYGMPEHRDPHGETTNTRRTQQYHTSFQTPQRNHHPHSSGTHHHPPATSFPPSPTVKPTPMKHSSGASVSSFHSRGSIMSYSSAAPPTGGKSTISATTSVVSKDKYAIKSTKKVIDELKKSTDIAYPMEKRIIALTNSCAEFDHLDDSRHNMELQQGAAVVLCKVLALILNSADAEDHGEKGGDYGIGNDYTPKSSTATGNDSKFTNGTGENGNTNANGNSSEDNDNYDDALRMIATALEMVFRGQSMYVHSAYDKCGGNAQYEDAITGPSPTGLLPLLLKLLDRAEGRNNGYRMKQHNAEVASVNATKVILYLSRVPALRVHLARQPSLLDALSRVASKDIFNNSTNNSSSNSTNTTDSNSSLSLSAEARIARVRIIANLVNQEENKSLLLEHRLKGIDQTNANSTTGSNSTEGVLDAILRVAHSDQNDRAREYASTALMDLASAPFNQIPMTKNEQLLGTLVKMIFLEKNPNTRESAITALQNLAFTKENRIRLVSFKRGVILEALIRALSNTNKDFNEKSRRRSAGALTNLACDESAGLMGRHKGLLQTLSIVSTKDESPEVQTRAAMALTKLAASITVRMDALPNKTLESESSQEQGQGQENGENGDDSTTNVYSTLLDALVVASLSTVSNSVSAVLRVKARDPENRYLMAKHPGILDTLADMCLYDNGNGEKNSYSIDVIKDRDNATRALMHLTNESKNRTIMCTPTVLEALVRGASVTDEEIEKEAQRKQLQDVRDSAIRAIERLATEFSNRHKMAHHDGLIVAIARATEREAKLEAGMANGNGVVIDEQPALLNGKGTKTATNDSVECSSYNSVMTPRRPGTNTNQSQQQQDPQHAHLAKPLLMSLLVAM